MADAIEALQPQIVVVENVRGLLSAAAHRMEPDEATLGDGAGRPVLRAAGAVLGDLADLGYDAVWATVAAADVGAPHRRERVFIVARAADSDINRPRGNGFAAVGTESAQPSLASSFAPFPSGLEADTNYLFGHDHARPHVADSPCDGWDEGRPEPARLQRGFDVAVRGDGHGVDTPLLPTPPSCDYKPTDSPSDLQRHSPGLGAVSHHFAALLPTPTRQNAHDGLDNGRSARGSGGPTLLGAVSDLLPTPTASDCTGGGQDPDRRTGHTSQLIDEVLTTAWGKYEPAIRRWENLTRQAPPPTEPNKNGNPRLSAAFSEWLMGWPAGWVTDPAIGISRNDQLRIVGNGVCPQQAAYALNYLTAVAAN